MPSSGFPRGLLGKARTERVAYFRSFTMAHPILKEVDAALRQAIQERAGASLIFVYGPTGVGKTTLRLRIEDHLRTSLLPALRSDPGRLPVVGIEAAAPDSSQFSWKDYYRRALVALEEPLIGKKLHYRIQGLYRDGSGRITVDSRAVGLELRQALENTLIHRRPAAFLIDEAQHLSKMRGARRLQDQLDSIKSLASLTDTVHVLIGTYELLPFRNLSAQLSRRSIDIHFRRYRADNRDEYSVFHSVLFTFQAHLPLPGESDLLKHVDFCYERCVGCIGVLKDWLTRALSVALATDSPTLTRKILERTAWSAEQAERMATDAIEGETSLLPRTDTRNRLRALLALDTVAEHQHIPPTQNHHNRKNRVGQRNPARDPIGNSTGVMRAI